MRPREVDKKIIYVSYFKGNDNANDNPIYTRPIQIKGAVQNVSGSYTSEEYGTKVDYTLKIYIEKNEFTKYIDEYTRFWVYKTPSHFTIDYDYKVVRVIDYDKDLKVIYLNSSQVDYDYVYILGDYDFHFQCICDKEKLKIYVPKTSAVNLDLVVGLNVCLEEPRDDSETYTICDIFENDSYKIYKLERVEQVD